MKIREFLSVLERVRMAAALLEDHRGRHVDVELAHDAERRFVRAAVDGNELVLHPFPGADRVEHGVEPGGSDQ